MATHNIITAKDITRSFTNAAGVTTHVLKGITLDITLRSFVSIMGKSGAGKSTLLYQLSMLDMPTGGSLTIDGTDVLAQSESEKTAFRLATLGFIFQDYALIPELTASENVMLPLLMRGVSYPHAREQARDALTKVGLSHRTESHPSALSGGEQQRVSIARAISGTPRILFADEPTANLDTISGKNIIELLHTLHQEGQTIIMVTHEPEYASLCDRIITMEDGRLIGDRVT
jgi:putative ABC transport system ATP-binding protein